ncbi:uncharacterized protein CIMG_13234 [Coccidioides immitis RS]|uniref:Uncharacterized protein n=1 Tax=Coccidioides immitis (strain RS) TaxID=246410 RepID=A0A0D8JV40_COCIM|nr:uncharacterized protein CIMG_13234 [Coccidioides immitis RS]KJF60796.1 hypothetical protein CIMG_13234 [Coccidioides immitis RS]
MLGRGYFCILDSVTEAERCASPAATWSRARSLLRHPFCREPSIFEEITPRAGVQGSRPAQGAASSCPSSGDVSEPLNLLTVSIFVTASSVHHPVSANKFGVSLGATPDGKTSHNYIRDRRWLNAWRLRGLCWAPNSERGEKRMKGESGREVKQTDEKTPADGAWRSRK